MSLETRVSKIGINQVIELNNEILSILTDKLCEVEDDYVRVFLSASNCKSKKLDNGKYEYSLSINLSIEVRGLGNDIRKILGTMDTHKFYNRKDLLKAIEFYFSKNLEKRVYD